MAALCPRCTSRLRLPHPTHRAFSTHPRRQNKKGVPLFTPTASPELDATLTTLRTQHLIPAYLRPPERRLIFGNKNRQLLADNPRNTVIGGEEIPLQWIDRRTEIPARRRMFVEAVESMVKAGADGKAWQNLPALLTGMKDLGRGTPESKAGQRRSMAGNSLGEGSLGKVVRKASAAGRMGIVVQCLNQVAQTGLSLKHNEVLEPVLWGLRDAAAADDWSEANMDKADRLAEEILGMLEMEAHGGGKTMRPRDARRRPEVVAAFLELTAVRAYKFQDGKDTDGTVRMYVERLLSCIGKNPQPPAQPPVDSGPQAELLNSLPIFHGLLLAERVLGADLPQADHVRKLREDYEAGIVILVQATQATPRKGNGELGGYMGHAVRSWEKCLRD
ncbi:hypothetical protein LTR53_005144 [Teratosphaeriaceae sp. CCFEE 6253]|nr:hypothetical protein LTR53_005144 [Teratosphaeriaceae sp. CCFEE 6253]